MTPERLQSLMLESVPASTVARIQDALRIGVFTVDEFIKGLDEERLGADGYWQYPAPHQGQAFKVIGLSVQTVRMVYDWHKEYLRTRTYQQPMGHSRA